MKPAPFKYLRAESPQHAVELLKEHGEDSRLLAGGQTLVPMMNLRLSRPEIIIDIGRLALSEVLARPGEVSIGALTRHRAVIGDANVAAVSGVIPEAMRHIAHPTIRNHGTAGGSVAYADPTAEICALVMLLDGKIEALSTRGSRLIEGANYFRGAFNTALKPDEMITAIRLCPPSVPHGASFIEVSERKGDYAIAAAGATIVIRSGVIDDARIVLSGAASTPVRAPLAERLLIGKQPDERLLGQVGEAALEGRACYADIRASVEYRRKLLECLVTRAVSTAVARACE
jgi:carbon-monoxide dehydrogenase medium subunit